MTPAALPQPPPFPHVEAIHVASAAGAPMRALERVEAIAGHGLADDRYAAGTGHWSPIARRGDEVTLIEAEVIASLNATHRLVLQPGDTRRNLTTRGIRLDTLIGERFRVGSAILRGVRRCEPCSYLDELLGKDVLHVLVHRGGIRAEVVESGRIAVGDGLEGLD